MSESKGNQEFDLHGHTEVANLRPLYFENVSYSPEQAVLIAKDKGLDGIAVSDHDSIRGLDQALNAAAKHGLIVVPGVEITSWEKTRFPHILVLGLNPELVKDHPLPTLRHPETVIKWAHDQGAIAIAAHPTEQGDGSIFTLSPDKIKEYQSLLDGIETANTFWPSWENKSAQDLACQLGLPRTGGSDFHLPEAIGLVETRILAQCQKWQEVVAAIKTGQTEPFIKSDIPPELRVSTSRLHSVLRTKN